MSPLLLQEITELPDYNKISFKEQAPVPLEEVLPDASPQALDSRVRPHRWQPTRLPCPWDSPGKNTGVGCHALLQGIFPT